MRTALASLGIAISAALLFRSLRRARHPMVVRELFDGVRHFLQLGAVVAVVVITGVRVPVPLLALALVAGLVVGVVVGTSLQLEPREQRIFATRSVVGASVWGAGLIATQIAGLAAKTGVFQVGQAISWFGVATAIGTFGGRRRPLQQARAALPKAVAVGALLLIVGAIAMGSASETRTAEARPTMTPGWWQLTSMYEEDMTTAAFTSISHFPGAIEASVDIEGFGSSFSATYGPYPFELQPGVPLSFPVEVSGNASGIIQRYTSMAVIQLTDAGWNGISVGVEANCVDPIGDAPVSCTPPATVPGVFTYDIPALTPGTTLWIGVGVLGCECGIWALYTDTSAVVDTAVPDTGVADTAVFDTAPSVTDGLPPLGGSSDDDYYDDHRGPPDDEDVSDDEALQTSIAVVGIISLIGLVDLAERRGGKPGDGRDPGGSGEPPLPPDGPSASARADALADQAIRFAQDATGPLVNYDAVYDQIRELQERINSGHARPGDMETLTALRDALWAIGQAERDGTISAAAREAALLAALENVMAVEMEFGKAAAGTFGPTSASIYAGFVESVANRDKGAAAALGHGAVGGVAAWIGTPSGSAIGQLTNTWSVLRAGGGNAMQNAGEDLGHQMVDAGGDTSQIDLSRTGGSALVGFVTGGGGHIVRPGVHVEDANWNSPTTHTRATPLDPPPRLPGAEPPRVAPADQPSWPSRPPTNVAPDAVDVVPSIDSWPRDAAGRILDPGGNHLMTHTPSGLQAPDGTPISAVITDRSGRPIGYQTPDGRQVLSVEPDPSFRPTGQDGPRVADPDGPAATQI